MPGVIVWLRNDLRLRDNPALYFACRTGVPVYPLYILEEGESAPQPGSASRVWMHHSLGSLRQQFQKKRSRVILRRGRADQVVHSLLQDTGADRVYWNRRYEPAGLETDRNLEARLRAQGYEARSFRANLLYEPHAIVNKQGNPYKVFTPFYRACLSAEEPEMPLAIPAVIASPVRWPASDRLDEINRLPDNPWHKGVCRYWEIGTLAAERCLDRFLNRVDDYEAGRDYPARDNVSRLSPYLHFGEISVCRIWHRILQQERRAGRMTPSKRVTGFLRQLVWRDFAHHLLFHFPYTIERPLRPEFSAFPWRRNKRHLRAWQQGRTGYPIVDAGMRELWQTGWMHNRVRMIAASFLVKDLLIDWRAGAHWFLDTLVDADLANNTLGWQWVAGSGADAAPFFRIFNPVKQSEKFDHQADYIRRWVPELEALDDHWIHKPWQAPPLLLEEAGVQLGRNYPFPIIDHNEARHRALAALQSIKN